jgi:hypothetical protein
MTDRDATELKIQLDAMRMARAEDAKTCARLTARVKELEAEVASLRHARDHWLAKAGEQADAVMRAHAMLAEGTRDEKAARCAGCLVPVQEGAILCAGCEPRLAKKWSGEP